MKNVALFGIVLGLLAHAIDAIRKTSNAGHQAQSISAQRHTSVHGAALITRVNRWLGCGQLTRLGRSLSTTRTGRDCRPLAGRRSASRYASSTADGSPVGAVKATRKGS